MDRSLAGYSPWGHKESDMTEETENTLTHWPFIYLLWGNVYSSPLPICYLVSDFFGLLFLLQVFFI